MAWPKKFAKRERPKSAAHLMPHPTSKRNVAGTVIDITQVLAKILTEHIDQDCRASIALQLLYTSSFQNISLSSLKIVF